MILNIVVGCTGCVHSYKNFEGSLTRKVMLKQNVYSSTGQFAAFNKDRIYYISQEADNNGIYSMKTDGSDIKFELETTKVTRIQVTDNEIYYVGVKEERENKNRLYGLYEFDRSNPGIKSVNYTDIQSDATTEDAFVFASGTIAVMDETGLFSTLQPSTGIFVVSNNTNYNFVKRPAKISEDFFIAEFQDFIIVSRSYPNAHKSKNMINDFASSLVDVHSGEYVMDNLFEDELRVFYSDEKQIISSLNNVLIFIDRDTLTENRTITIGKTNENQEVAYIFKDGDILYVVMRNDNDRYNSSLFSVDISSAEVKKITSLNAGKLVLNIDKGKIYWVKGANIYCNLVNSQRIGDRVSKITIDETITDSDNSIEIAGNWLFIYKNSDINELCYKINLANLQVIKINRQ